MSSELQRVAEEKEVNAKRLADWQEKRATMDCSDPQEDYMWWKQEDSDDEFIERVKYEH